MSIARWSLRTLLLTATFVVLLAPAAPGEVPFLPERRPQADIAGAVFTMTNSTDPARGNEVVVYARAGDGSLSFHGTVSTGGIGGGPAPTSTVFGTPIPFTADSLGSQSSIALSEDHRYLFVVNAGSNSISCLRVTMGRSPRGTSVLRVTLRAVVDSGGVFPVSLALRRLAPTNRHVLYALNAGDGGSIQGFDVAGGCRMRPMSGGARSLVGLLADPPFPSPEPGEVVTTAAQVGTSASGELLFVTVKGTNGGATLAFPVVARTGELREVRSSVTPGDAAAKTAGPFGFAFDAQGRLFLNHGASHTLGSYTYDEIGNLVAISDPVPVSGIDGTTHLQFGSFNCWITVFRDLAFVVSFGDIPATNGGRPDGPGIIHVFRIGADGSLTPAETAGFDDPGVLAVFPQDDRDAADPELVGNHGIDLTFVNVADRLFLYALMPRNQGWGAWEVSLGRVLDAEPLDVTPGGLLPGPDPYPGTNPGIVDFLTRCHLQAAPRSPECALGSPQGAVGF